MLENPDVDDSLHWLLLILPVALIAILLISRLANSQTGKRSSGSKKSRRGSVPKNQTGSPVKLEKRAPEDNRPGDRLSREEREAMLDGVKNLARENPEKVAGLIRNWMQDDDSKS